MTTASYIGAIIIGAVGGAVLMGGSLWGYAARRARANDERERALDMRAGEFETERVKRERALNKRACELNERERAGQGAAPLAAVRTRPAGNAPVRVLTAARPTGIAPVRVLTAAGRHQATNATPRHHLAAAYLPTSAPVTVEAAA